MTGSCLQVRPASLSGPPLFLSASCDWSGKFWEVSVQTAGIELPPEYAFSRGRNAPTNRPGSYEGFGKRPQFYPLQGGALIRNELQAGRGSIFRGRSIAWGAFLLTGDPLQLLLLLGAGRGRLPSGRFRGVFSSHLGFEPPDDASAESASTD